MNNLFSTFDPQTGLGLPLNWLAFLLPLIACGPTFWSGSSHVSTPRNLLMGSIMKEFSAILRTNSSPGILILSVSLFSYIFLLNSAGLAPYTFTPSSHLSATLALALPLWLGHVCLTTSFLPKNALAHLVPLGTPLALTPFMVMIELVSNSIRPLTLSVRLAANMTAGHLLLSLLGNSGNPSSSLMTCTVMIAMVSLCLLEAAVAIVQAYVFATLSSLYLEDVNSPLLQSPAP